MKPRTQCKYCRMAIVKSDIKLHHDACEAREAYLKKRRLTKDEQFYLFEHYKQGIPLTRIANQLKCAVGDCYVYLVKNDVRR